MKKLLNNPDRVVDDMVDGVLDAYGETLQLVGSTHRALVRTELVPGKVGIVIGGGSGHEPAFLGYVGQGFADGVALGNVFASPSPDPIVDAARAVDQGAGVLLIYGNYAGDCMNFEMAAELLAMENIKTASVVVRDDVASAPKDRSRRRGIAGEVFIYKIAGALAANGYTLHDLAVATQSACDHIFSIGVAWSPCTLPQTGKASFEIGDDEMEVGLGVHGEPGVYRRTMVSANHMAAIMIEQLMPELAHPLGRLAVMINGLGSTSQMELYVLYHALAKQLRDLGADVAQVMVGNFITSQEMAGCSLTILLLDAVRERALEAAGISLGWTQFQKISGN